MEVSSKNFLQEDVTNFFTLISNCIGMPLTKSKNTIDIDYPDWDSHNTSKSVLCKIDNVHYVCLKKYDDNLHFAKHEVLISKLKKQVGFPYYNVIESQGLLLRDNETKKNTNLLQNWEDKLFLAIDFGHYNKSKNLRDLPVGTVKNSESFYRFYGKWAAFNYLFGIQDRNSSNFIYFLDTGIMHSVDNEAGPFDWLNRHIGVLDIIYRTRKGFERYLVNSDHNFKDFLMDGFVDGWNQIVSHSDKITDLNEDEMKLFTTKLLNDPKQIARIFFNYDIMWNKL